MDFEERKEAYVLEGHTDEVRATKFSRDGTLLVTGSKDNTVRVWNFEERKQVALLEGHEKAVNAVMITADNNHIVSASSDSTIRVWSLEDHSEKKCLKKHNDAVYCLSLSPEGDQFCSGDKEGVLLIWNIKNWSLEHTFKKAHLRAILCAKWGPKQRYIVTGSQDTTVRVFDLWEKSRIGVLRGHKGSVSSLDIAPSSKYAISVGDDMMIRKWTLFEFKTEMKLENKKGEKVTTMYLMRDDSTLVVGCTDHVVRVYDLRTEERINEIPLIKNGRDIN